MKKRLITSALPYVNNIPHLGNLIQVLSADVFARFCRSRGYETLYVCGSDENGTATETRALEEGVTPQELCDRYHKIHTEIYQWFNISFDRYGRTATPQQTEITQDIFLKAYENGYITEHTIQQLYSEKSDMFLADRYVYGECPHCGYDRARGDQCESCGKLLEPTELIGPRSMLDDSVPVLKDTRHLYLNLPGVLPKLQAWMDTAAKKGRWANNAVKMTEAWIRDGLKERAITRDLKWGVPVPLEGFEKKVFYVWFDAPIGYISITAGLTDDWQSWWKNPDEVELFQFIGKDNIPFHTVIFPCSLLASGDSWTMLHHMSSSEYLNYEAGKFSKSQGIGVFGTDAQDTGIPSDVWRFYLYYNRPESSDYMFTWDDFLNKVNGELIGNFSNLVNRTMTFLYKNFDATVPSGDEPSADAGGYTAERSAEFQVEVRRLQQELTEKLEWAEIRDAYRMFFQLCDLGNRTFQANEPWKSRKEDPASAERLMRDLVMLVRDLGILAEPFTPDASQRIAAMLGQSGLSWENLGDPLAGTRIAEPEILFRTLDPKLIGELRERFSGSQKERAAAAAGVAAGGAGEAGATGKAGGAGEAGAEPELPVEQRFAQLVDLRVAEITKVEQHPEADKLYIEELDDGSGSEEPRIIVSGLKGHYTPEELQGQKIILVNNLKAAKLRGVKSHGMLLAADGPNPDGEAVVDVVVCPDASPGDRILVEGFEDAAVPEKKLKIDQFFDLPIRVEDGVLMVGNARLLSGGNPITPRVVKTGEVG
ncbi:methionine--tRNA ligase [Spirochaeta africana]|uniref:Methionine--tRNA ligase n=1 Tax=Spirochaeta africana (strain ATCC 700263 / DSM 8902 / Z-7692) TaxID=889378 RepID=H9UIY4_SPIAZ|nr:methionine--tRNA ligase [Spirochaeta africana]AFG37477.1 methionyl-tRNA synthetase [Spirochaeta africana DSM 8902]